MSHPDPDPTIAHDGLVTVASQRLDGVETELVVESGHSTQLHPVTIQEVARILREAPVEPPQP